MLQAQPPYSPPILRSRKALDLRSCLYSTSRVDFLCRCFRSDQTQMYVQTHYRCSTPDSSRPGKQLLTVTRRNLDPQCSICH